MGRKTVCLTLLLIIVSAVCSAATATDYWTRQALAQLAYAGLIPQDAVSAGLSRLEAAELAAAAIAKADGQTLTEENLQSLDRLLLEFQSELAASEVSLTELREKLEKAKQDVQRRRNKISPWSEAKGLVSISPGGGGNPRVFNAVRLRPLSLDGKTRLGFTLYMENALGGASDQISAMSTDFYFNTTLAWGREAIYLTLGNFLLTNTPFTIYSAFHQDDTWREARREFNGVRVQTKALGLNWQGFLSRTADGNGSGFDRYLCFSSVAIPQKDGEAKLNLLRTWDDLASSGRTQGALSSTTVGLSFLRRGGLWGKSYNISGEGNLNFLEQDVYDTAVATTEFAARLAGRINFALPIDFTYYAISDQYPRGITAIQSIGADFVYQYEENPWEPYYIANVQRLELTTGNLKLGKYLELKGKWDRAKELFPTGDSPKSFGYLGAELVGNIEKFLPASWARNQKLHFTVGEYKTYRREDADLRQQVRSVSFSQKVLNNLDLALGYEEYGLTGRQNASRRSELAEVPFAELTWRPFSGSTLTWLVQPRREKSGEAVEEILKQKVRLSSSIGPSTWLKVGVDLAKTAAQQTQSINIEYRSGF